MDRHRRGHKQTVEVRHLHIHSGAQGVVGIVNARKTRGAGPAPGGYVSLRDRLGGFARSDLQNRVAKEQADSLRLLVDVGGHGAFVAAFRNRAEIVLAYLNRQSDLGLTSVAGISVNPRQPAAWRQTGFEEPITYKHNVLADFTSKRGHDLGI